MWQGRLSSIQFNQVMSDLASVARAKIENAKRILPILASDPRIGYGHCYSIAYDREMVEIKLRQCDYVLRKEIPRLGSFIRFHLWNKFP